MAQNASSQEQSAQNPLVLSIDHLYNKAIVKFKIKEGWKLHGPSKSSIGKPLLINVIKTFNIKNYRIYFPLEQKGVDESSGNATNYYFYQNFVEIPLLIEPEDISKPVSFKIAVEASACGEECVLMDQELSYEFIVDNVDEFKEELHLANILAMCMFSIIGGVMLNFMPCVLPVLSLKIISIIKKSGKKAREIRYHLLGIISGILFIFIINALIIAILRHAGQFAGWGMHFQNKYFLIFLISSIVLFANSLLGVFPINLPPFIGNRIDNLFHSTGGYLSDFLYGVFGTLLATSCTAPILSTSLVFTLSQNIYVIFCIYLCIGLGMAFPYLLLFISPSLIKLIPKPGPWMIKIKKFFAILMLLTAIWLIPVLQRHIGWGGIATFVALLSIITLLTSSKRTDKRYLVSAAFFIFTIALVVPREDVDTKISNKYWQEFSLESLNKNITKGKTVLVDITADWCLTCKYNSNRVFTDDFLKMLKEERGVILLRGDYTLKSKEISKFLALNNKLGVPCNILYTPCNKTGVYFSELLAKQEILDELEKSKKCE
ncbi:DsdD family thiol:disulfide interchange protein DsbD precursor [Candidatus Cyrtobacter comes]|uniref:DsdD family thiol:disulfide interchange protein DsbD n=1 Tax=Candidatus Cyrtobacter comes TaxID=675776 RepID=A0ABU5L8X6_9RICK|nr:DsdD family thiol:disulfide interchange protein DsbD precursor [Candidatus Cyrtobacter comes]